MCRKHIYDKHTNQTLTTPAALREHLGIPEFVVRENFVLNEQGCLCQIDVSATFEKYQIDYKPIKDGYEITTAQILVVPEDAFFFQDAFTSYNGKSDRVLSDLLQDGTFFPRCNIELDPVFKQIIPYVLVYTEPDKVLMYRRSQTSGEQRLHDKYSLGVGGHIEQSDHTTIDRELFDKAMIREVKEEIGVKTTPDQYEILGFIYDDSDEVSSVHLGVVAKLCLYGEDCQHGEIETLVDRQIVTHAGIRNLYDIMNWERWSDIVIQSLIGLKQYA